MSAETINIILSLILTISTVIYVVLTNRLVRESKKTRRFQESPFIVASISFNETDKKAIILKIKNIGLGYAQNVTFLIQKDYEWVQNKPLKERGAFKNGITSFPPNYELNYIVVIINKDENVNNILENEFIEFSINYENIHKEKYSHSYKLRFNEIISQGYATPPLDNEGSMVYYLKKISEELRERKK